MTNIKIPKDFNWVFYKTYYKDLDNFTEDEKYLILSEGRPLRMQWIILLPK